MARIAISTAYMCFRNASDAVYSCISARASGRVRVMAARVRLGADDRRGERHPAGELAIEGDLEGVLPGTGEGDVEHQHRPGLHVGHAGRRLTELHRALSAEQLCAGLVHEANPDGVHSDLRAAPPDPEHQMGARADGRELGQPDVLEDAQHAELALLVDEGVVRGEGEIEMQVRTP